MKDKEGEKKETKGNSVSNANLLFFASVSKQLSVTYSCNLELCCCSLLLSLHFPRLEIAWLLIFRGLLLVFNQRSLLVSCVQCLLVSGYKK